MGQSFCVRKNLDGTASPRRIIERNEREAYQSLSDSVVGQKPVVPAPSSSARDRGWREQFPRPARRAFYDSLLVALWLASACTIFTTIFRLWEIGR